jgi:hypothetical protein
MRIFRITLLVLLLPAFIGFAQDSRNATITGTVMDSAGALMPGVRVEVLNKGTDVVHQVLSGSTGAYTIPRLPAGSYQISVSLPGFKQYIRTGVEVFEAQVIRIDIRMIMLTDEEILTNDAIIQLLEVGIHEDLIISKIRESQHSFDLSIQGMIQLKEGGVSDRLMHFMMDTSKLPAARTAPEPVRAEAPSRTEVEAPKAPVIAEEKAVEPESAYPEETGVYVKTGTEWKEISPEQVVWETGGSLKRFMSAGIIQGDVNGRLDGANSGTVVVHTPLEFIIVAPEGVTIAEYQLLRLRQQRRARHFRTVTGGIFSTSGGATRDAVDFSGERIVRRTFLIPLPTLEPGEYGFLPTSAGKAGSAANIGIMYTFQVPEVSGK